MDKQTQLLRFALGFQEASRRRDWQTVTQLDAELSELLGAWAQRFEPSPAERQALQLVRQAHAKAREECRQELDGLIQTLEQMRQGRERWSAYAASAGWSNSLSGSETAA